MLLLLLWGLGPDSDGALGRVLYVMIDSLSLLTLGVCKQRVYAYV